MKNKLKKSRILEIIKEEIENFKSDVSDMGTPQSGEESSIQTSLHMIQEYSSKLIDVQDQLHWEDWMQDKLTLASRDLDSIWHNFEGQFGGKEIEPDGSKTWMQHSQDELMEDENITPIIDYLEGSEVILKKLSKFIGYNKDQVLPSEMKEDIINIYNSLQKLEEDFLFHYKNDYDEDDYDLMEGKSQEDYVKSLKKNMKSFKDKYGKDWKKVMYGTATNMAKKGE